MRGAARAARRGRAIVSRATGGQPQLRARARGQPVVRRDRAGRRSRSTRALDEIERAAGLRGDRAAAGCATTGSTSASTSTVATLRGCVRRAAPSRRRLTPTRARPTRDRRLVAALEDGLPLVAAPYADARRSAPASARPVLARLADVAQRAA